MKVKDQSQSFEQQFLHSIQGTRSQACSSANNHLYSQVQYLQHEYARMEMEYSRKIKELKNCLLDKTKKQMSLGNELTALHEEFKLHQEQIAKINQELSPQLKSEKDAKSVKKHSPNGLIKKSLEQERKNISPNHPNNKLIFLPINSKQKKHSNNSPTIDNRTPKHNNKPTSNMFRPQRPEAPKTAHNAHNHSGQVYTKSTSPKNNEKKVGINLFKPVKQKPENLQNSNNSPRKVVRNSPGQRVKIFKTENLKPVSKQMLGGLKEAVEEVF